MVHRNEDIQFTVSDLSEGYIYYAHSRDLGGAQDQFTIRVGDGHSVSHAEPINILIEEVQKLFMVTIGEKENLANFFNVVSTKIALF